MGSDDSFRSEAPTTPDETIVACPACQDDEGVSIGDVLAQLPSGTWVRRRCDVCLGLRKVDREGLARFQARGGGA